MNILYNRLHCTTPCQSTWDRDLKSCLASHPRVSRVEPVLTPFLGLVLARPRPEGFPIPKLLNSWKTIQRGEYYTLCGLRTSRKRHFNTPGKQNAIPNLSWYFHLFQISKFHQANKKYTSAITNEQHIFCAINLGVSEWYLPSQTWH